MNKIKITLEIETKHRNKRSTSKLEKLIDAFVRLWKATITSNLRPGAKTTLLRQIIVSSTLFALVYLLAYILPFVLNRP